MSIGDSVCPSAMQKIIGERYGLPMLAPEDKVALAMTTLGQSPIYGSRVEMPEGGDVSWFIHSGEYSPAERFYQPIHANHLEEVLPQVVNYLWLPTGSKFIIDTEGYEEVWMAE